MQARILIVDDEASLRTSVAKFLAGSGYATEAVGDAKSALEKLEELSFDLLLLDINLGHDSGLDLLRTMRELGFDQPVIMISALGTFDNSVRAMRSGAVDFLRKPFPLQGLSARIELALERSRRQRELEYLRDSSQGHRRGTTLLGDHSSFKQLIEDMHRIAALARGLEEAARPPVLITGETGSGKNMLARQLHDSASSSDSPFITINCTSLPASLFEAELFGHERGAFTGADRTRQGLFETAGGGTIFLDEIGHLPLALQAKLLSAIDEKMIRRVGSSDQREINTWVVAATNADISQMVTDGEFRADLFYRISTFHLRMPPLRDRGDDILLLAEHFLRQSAEKYRLRLPLLPAAVKEAMLNYTWPGNLRELRNLMERTVVRCSGGEITMAMLASIEPALVSQPEQKAQGVTTGDDGTGLVCLPSTGAPFEDFERDLLRQAMALSGGNASGAARLLHLSRERFRSRWKRTVGE